MDRYMSCTPVKGYSKYVGFSTVPGIRLLGPTQFEDVQEDSPIRRCPTKALIKTCLSYSHKFIGKFFFSFGSSHCSFRPHEFYHDVSNGSSSSVYRPIQEIKLELLFVPTIILGRAKLLV